MGWPPLSRSRQGESPSGGWHQRCRELLEHPRHEYTRGLLASVLSTEKRAKRLYQIPGSVPAPQDFARGDRFAPRSLEGVNADEKTVWRESGEHGYAAHVEDKA